MKKFYLIILIIIFLSVGFFTRALTMGDIDLLVTLGIISGEQADLAKGAINSLGEESGTVGSSISSAGSTTKCLFLNQNLFKGNSGTAVSALQEFLKGQGHYKYGDITGYFGLTTEEAVKDFQIVTGLIKSSLEPGAGTVGPLTRGKIQEVSCTKSNSGGEKVAEQQKESVGPYQIYTYTTFTPDKLDAGPASAKLYSTLISGDRPSGTAEYRYTMEIDDLHDEVVKSWRAELSCNEKDINVYQLNSKLKDSIDWCGDAAFFKASSKGNATFKLEYTNLSGANQMVGISVKAYDKKGNLLAEDEIVDNLPPRKASDIYTNNQGFQIVPGTNNQVTIPRQRICDTSEQIAHLRYAMTKTLRVGDPIAPPACWPGEIICNNYYPPSVCAIAGGPSSNEICPTGEFFYDGICYNLQRYLSGGYNLTGTPNF